MRDPETLLLRRYVLERAAGRVPAAEYARLEEMGEGIGAWIRCDRQTAQAARHWRRLRRAGTLWCPVLGSRLDIAQDAALQAFFMTIPDDDWSRLAAAVRARPSDCLRRWQQAGRRILVAAAAVAMGNPPPPGRLAGWPGQRGTGPRSLLPG